MIVAVVVVVNLYDANRHLTAHTPPSSSSSRDDGCGAAAKPPRHQAQALAARAVPMVVQFSAVSGAAVVAYLHIFHAIS